MHIGVVYLEGPSNFTSLLYVTPIPSQEDSSTTVTNLSPSSTQIEAPTNLDIKIIVAAIFAGLVLLVAVTIAFMMAMLSSRSYHRSRKNVQKHDQLQLEVNTDSQRQNYDHL